jgi:hypothetical protein
MRGSVAAEFLLLRKRRSTWILLGIWTALAAFFSYLLPYVEYRNGISAAALEKCRSRSCCRTASPAN